MASNDDMVARISAAVCNALRNSQQQGIVGRPRLVLSKEAIEGYLDMGYSVSQTAEACGVSRSVLYSRMQQLGISYRDRFSRLDNNSLDAAVTDIKMSHPNCGEVMIIGHLRARGIIVQRSRVRESIHRVDPQGADDRRCRGIRRRVYSVPCPNFIWHLDVTTIHPKLCQICSSVQSVSMEDHSKYELTKEEKMYVFGTKW
ncbi:uncharacterized protein LOC122948369 [Acropora millepora]|uniref:uncharacterized protein LOC122948369 n=1 Tax=Acropora millepora TaxID=45264 RepID=UPI001CF47293|nr:uncharacterized protein LOC114964114 isoform X2 [Acropora millepora]XP_044164100.1 uncharacterized protein LOC122948369 [Acropora millepora]